MAQLSDKTALKRGRGKGTKDSYVPFIHTYDFKGKGRKHKIPSLIYKRERHGLSTIEANLIYVTEMADNIEDSREQFPLDLELTKLIASQLGIKHPSSPDKKRQIMTFDLLLDFHDKSQMAIAIKPFNKLHDKRVIEILQIQKTYAERMNLKFGILTEKDFPPILVANLRLLRSYIQISDDLNKLTEIFYLKLKNNNSAKEKMNSIIKAISMEMKMVAAKGWAIFYHLCATKVIRFNYFETYREDMTYNKFTIHKLK
jgi:hypothetical protein